MRFKVDENLHPEVASILSAAGHDAQTVWDQDIVGIHDSGLAEIIRVEQRALVTLDLDFADIRSYPPEEYGGLIVLRLAQQDRAYVRPIIERMIQSLSTHPLKRHLWMIDEQSIRIRGPRVDEEAD